MNNEPVENFFVPLPLQRKKERKKENREKRREETDTQIRAFVKILLVIVYA
jgi:hypothetical protein